MSDLRDVIVIGAGPIKDAAALHGADIGYVYLSTPPVALQVDFAAEHDGWVPITNPSPWKDSGRLGWIKKSRIAEATDAEETYIITGKNIVIRRVS